MAGLLLALGLAASAAAAADTVESAGIRAIRLPLATDSAEHLVPARAEAADLARYRQIFALQRAGRWAEADRVIARLEDPTLLGHVLAERYLHPTAYRSSYAELAAWLARHADLPQAKRIHRLAAARRPPGAAPPPRPVEPPSAPAAQVPGSRAERVPPPELWRQGIVFWRKGAGAAAADRFARLASLNGEGHAGAAFWAARASLRERRPQQAARFLRLAARSGDGFYGPLARAALDSASGFGWSDASPRARLLALVLRYPAVRRAELLARVGERELARSELARVAAAASAELADTLAAVAASLELPSAELRVAGALPLLDSARGRPPFPRLPWEPAGGYRLDPALVHAVVGAESGFDPKARSPKGALGLMQVMPATARLAAKELGIAYGGERWLLHPPTNLRIGQAWLRRLAAGEIVGNSLIHLLAAYNAGEGRVADWARGELRPAARDPLLYIESVPIPETRAYIKRVLAGLWAYQARQGRPTPSLAALAGNRWPEVEAAGGFLAAAQERVRHARAY